MDCLRFTTVVLAMCTLVGFGESRHHYLYNTIKNCSEETQYIDLSAQSGVITFNISVDTPDDTVRCEYNVTGPRGRRFAIDVSSDEMVLNKVGDVCARVDVIFEEPKVSTTLVRYTNTCANTDEEFRKETTSFYSDNNSFRMSLGSEPNTIGPIVFTLSFVVFKDKYSDDCFYCRDIGNITSVPMCINTGLLCDGIKNCPGGSDENYKYTKKYGCPFVCDGVRLPTNRICNGVEECSSGLDESSDFCSKIVHEPFSRMSLFDKVVSTLCAILALFLLIVCCGCCLYRKPQPAKHEKTYIVRTVLAPPPKLEKYSPSEKEIDTKELADDPMATSV
ncbi:uncharacterized protein LOC100375240 [Saccoglossus kowalevskii]|uniref:Uncharacterized protein LOC100375240 n=1 Tax=Saccoglossus kowalevskii TaxID=10224 RepID=A0ABM0GXU1_SACKO|nr:PREDICTED: uncharacterized protein LOC100375240 [Saccoglossus kowalevskii]